jgi:peptidoglycan/LPS O-acetylase OafA/YrhL
VALTKSKVVNWLCVKLSKYSFSVYLIHAAMLQEFLANHPYSNQTAIGILLTTIVVYIQAVLFVLIFDNLITFNVNRIVELAIRFAKDCFEKLMLRLKTDKLA